MDSQELETLRYPIGKFKFQGTESTQEITAWIEDIKSFPAQMRIAVSSLNPTQLSWPYRPDGWMIKQVLHHCVDSHMNALIRFKLALTEDAPIIRPYHEDLWAKLPEYQEDDLTHSLNMLDGIHHQMAALMSRLNEDELARVYVHPEHGRKFTLKEAIGLYAWHGNHHLAHIKQAQRQQGIF
jgi:hypothetical protein